MVSLPIYGAHNARSPKPAPLAEPPRVHLVPGPSRLVLVIEGSQIYEIDEALYARIERGDQAALAELPAGGAARRLGLFDVRPPLHLSSLSLNLAQACNLGCHYCYADEGKFQGSARVMTEEVAFAAVDRLIDGAALERPRRRVTVGFIGGEPLLNRPVLHATVAHARGRAAAKGVPIGFSITTNATLLTDEDVALLRDHAFAVTVSLDGDAIAHDRHRPSRDGRGSHARALAALAPLLARPGGAKVSARATITRDDMRVAERVAALLDLGFLEAGVSPARTSPDPSLPLRLGDWQCYLAEMIRAADIELARVTSAKGREPFRFSNFGLALKEIHRGACRPLPCGSAFGYASVSAEGAYYTCHRTIDDPRFSLGSAEDGPSLDARAAFLAQRHVDRQEPCRTCWARYLCGGGCHAEVARAGREGCDFIRGWLDHGLRVYGNLNGDLLRLLGDGGGGSKEGAS